MSPSILLFGSMGDIADTVAASLRRHALNVEVVPFPQNVFRDEQGYRRELTKALQRIHPQLVLPIGHLLAPARLVHPEEDILPPLLEQEMQGVIIPVDTPAHIRRLDSKVQASALAAELGILQPQRFASAGEAGTAPVVFKRDRSFGGSGVFRPRTQEALKRLVEREGTRPFLIEAYVEGWDCSVDAIRWNGQFHAACYRTLSRRQGQGPSTLRTPCVRTDVVAAARQILDAIDYRGVCGMDFRISTDGKPFFLECNPRFTGGLATHIEAGFDIPYLLLSHLTQL